VAFDFLATLRSELAAQGVAYDVVRTQQEADLEAPAGAPVNMDIRLTMRDVILAKAGLPADELSVRSTSSANFSATLTVPTAVGPVTIRRGWTSADVTVNRRPVRFINTHLEAFDPGIRERQAAELVGNGGPAASAVTDPIVLVGDLNSDPNQPAPDSTAFNNLAAAGFADTWVQVNGTAPGFTFGFGELLDDPDASGFDRRFDHVLTRAAQSPASAARVTGTDADNRTPSGLWPSDHAGVVSTTLP
jgi:endonuclease/exonuclease/phosphatase family metal-dependent hydrolase